MPITKEMLIAEILEVDSGIAAVLMMCGMHCVGCPASLGESLEEACAVHGLDPEEVLQAIQDYLDEQK